MFTHSSTTDHRCRLTLAFTAFALCCSLVTPAQAGLLTDGNFTSFISGNNFGTNGGSVCTTSACTASNLTYWTATASGAPVSLLTPTSNGVAWNNSNGLDTLATGTGPDNLSAPPVSGNIIAVDGDVTYRASFSQSGISLVAGQTYDVQFYQAAAQQKGSTGATVDQWQVTIDGQTLYGAVQNDPSTAIQPWVLQTLEFTAQTTSSSDTLTFTALGEKAGTSYSTPAGIPPLSLLAGVSLQTTPEPQTYALVGFGVLALVGLSRRRSIKKA